MLLIETTNSDPISESVRATMRAFLGVVTLSEPLAFELWRSHQMTLTQVQCLRYLRTRPIPAGDLARTLGLAAASMTRVLERLEDRQLVSRSVDLDDRRRVLVTITDLGLKILGGLDFWLNSPVVEAVKTMTADERRRVIDGMECLAEHVRRHLDQTMAAGSPEEGRKV